MRTLINKKIHYIVIIVLGLYIQQVQANLVSDALDPGGLGEKAEEELEDAIGIDIPGLNNVLEGDYCGAIPGCNELDNHASSCYFDFDLSACAISIADPGFINHCSTLIKISEVFYEQNEDENLGDVVLNNKNYPYNLYPHVEEIFENLLGATNFSERVKDINHYEVSQEKLFGSEVDARTTNGEIYYNSSEPWPELIFHELVHIWQYDQMGEIGFSETHCQQVAQEGTHKLTYEFTLSRNKNFFSYSHEQQAELIEEYARIVELGKGRVPFCDDEENFLNCGSYVGDYNRLKSDFESVLRTATAHRTLIPIIFNLLHE